MLDSVIKVANEDAFAYARSGQGGEILAGISTGAAIAAVAQKVAQLTEKNDMTSITYGNVTASVDGLY